MAAAKLLATLCVLAAWAGPLLALPDKPLAYKLTQCVGESGPPNLEPAPLQVCILPAVVYYRLEKEDWHKHFKNCVAKKTTNDPKGYGYWANDAAYCVDKWSTIR